MPPPSRTFADLLFSRSRPGRYAELYATHIPGPQIRKGFHAALYSDESWAASADTYTLDIETGRIRIAYNPTTKVLTVSYNTPPVVGWTSYGSFGIAGSGGLTGNTNWGMTGGDTFQVGLYGYSTGMLVEPGELYGDDFQTAGGVPVP